MTRIAPLPDRAVLEVAGQDRVPFLQGLVSNDVALAAPGRAVWAALLTPQGKWLADFFISATPDTLLLDVESAQAPTLAQTLSRYRLRAKVAITQTPLQVAAAWDGPPPFPPPFPGTATPDPRLAEAGWRLLAETLPPLNATPEDYDAHRLALGLPAGSRDMESGKTTLLEAGFDALQGISWTKGCYMGQELTARTKYRGLLKRQLTPVTVEGPLPPSGTPITAAGTEVGHMRSGRGTHGLALLRLGTTGPLTCATATLHPHHPSWLPNTPPTTSPEPAP